MSAYYTIGGSTISIGGAMLRELVTGTLTVVCAMDAVGAYDPYKYYSIVVTFSNPVTYGGSTSTTHTLSMMGGQSVTFTDIPELTTFEITESPLSSSDLDAGYTTAPVSGGVGKIVDSNAYTATAQYYYLEAKSMLVRVSEGADPTTWDWRSDVTLSQYATDVWCVSWYYNSSVSVCKNKPILEVLAANFKGMTTANEWFSECTSLSSLFLYNTGGIQNMYRMFYHCTSLTSAPMFDTSGATDMHTMFSECHNLVSVPLYDTSSVTNMSYMFDRNYALPSVPLFDTGNVTNMREMFRSCGHLQSVPLFNTANVTEVFEMFLDCTAVESGAFALYSQMSTQTTPPTSHSSCFRNCGSGTTTGAAELAQIPSGWK